MSTKEQCDCTSLCGDDHRRIEAGIVEPCNQYKSIVFHRSLREVPILDGKNELIGYVRLTDDVLALMAAQSMELKKHSF